MYTDANNSLLSKAPQTGLTRQDAVSQANKTQRAAEVVELRPGTNGQPLRELPPAEMAELEQAVENLNQTLQDIKRELRFSVDDDTGRTIVKVINADTDEVVRQIPSEQLLNTVRHMEQQAGLLLDTEA
ncbi:MAG: flagellar protein FlaG [Gammaproteobacteria bacterium]|nr:flagellar protein FlaG [Gammaproteobacteria bacterium]